jgi:hypothetical protein
VPLLSTQTVTAMHGTPCNKCNQAQPSAAQDSTFNQCFCRQTCNCRMSISVALPALRIHPHINLVPTHLPPVALHLLRAHSLSR